MEENDRSIKYELEFSFMKHENVKPVFIANLKGVLLFIFAFVLAGSFVTLVIVLPYLQAKSISEILLHFPGLDKIVHYFEYVLITLVGYYLLGFIRFKRHNKIRLITALLVAVVIAFADEIYQIYTPSRSFEFADFGANILGILTGLVIIERRKFGLKKIIIVCSLLLIFEGYLTYDSYIKQINYNLGVKYERDGQYALAKKHYLMAIESGNKNAGLYNNLAWLEVELLGGNPLFALSFAEFAVNKKPTDADILDTYGWVLFLLGRYEEALVYVKKAYGLDHKIFCINYHLGQIYLAMNNFESAQYHLEKQVALNPDDRYGLLAEKVLKDNF